MELIDNEAWIACRGGLVIIDTLTAYKRIIKNGNSPLKGRGVMGIEQQENGDICSRR